MTSAVTAYFVKIASPSDAAIEAVIAREVITDWNSGHTNAEKIVLVPRGMDRPGEILLDDLLVAFFTTAPTPATSGHAKQVSAEIGDYLAAGRAVLIYLSEGRAHFAAACQIPEQGLLELKKLFAGRATIDSIRDEKELRARFAQQLDAVVHTHPHFRARGLEHSPEVSPAAPPLPADARAPMSKLAQHLLFEACEDPEAYVGRFRDGNVLKIQANGQQLVEQGRPGAVEAWEAAINELLDLGFLRDAGCQGRLFQISAEGFAALKAMGKSPVGYIAELGGM